MFLTAREWWHQINHYLEPSRVDDLAIETGIHNTQVQLSDDLPDRTTVHFVHGQTE
jgi:hypothetical protein